MILEPGTIPFCVMSTPICELRLHYGFFPELREALPMLSIESIAYDVLQGLVWRETISLNVRKYKHSRGARVYALVHLLTTRDNIKVKDLRSQHYRLITEDELKAVRALLYRYGVSCAQEKCCVQQSVFFQEVS